MKALIALFLAVAAGQALATPAVEQARTGVPLDLAKVISVTDTGNACGVVPVQLVYDDSQGVRHIVTYQVMGNGCMGN
ncbi:MAG: hypothetical protein GAK36_00091 [Pseudomonas sp.]|nr:MAG: hypothetical protein GAK36_00091 [Pseudomonas sp.]